MSSSQTIGVLNKLPFEWKKYKYILENEIEIRIFQTKKKKQNSRNWSAVYFISLE